LKPKTEGGKKIVNVAILGAGFMGRMHAECYYNLPKAHLVAIGDANLKKAGEIAKKYAAHFSSQLDKLIENGNMDLVICAFLRSCIESM